MDSTNQDDLADPIGSAADGLARRRFWLAHMRIGFGIFLIETLFVMLYLALTPSGPHRPLLWAIAGVWAGFAAGGVLVAPIIASRPWRSVYSITWTVASTYAVGMVAILDTGLASPILFLLFLPLIFGTLMFSPRAATVCGASALLSLAVVGIVDQRSVVANGQSFMLFATVAGAALLSVAAAINRTHIEQHENHLLGVLAELASTDGLTGCAVRRVVHQRTEEEIQRAVRSHSPLSLLMIDVDQFKSVNDSYGHVVGDRVLATIGGILLDNVRAFDVAGRLGGDEFAILLPETDERGAVMVAVRVVEDLAEKAEVSVTLSIGITCLDRSTPTAEHLFDEADLALYQAKGAGRDSIVVRSPGAAPAGEPEPRARSGAAAGSE
jgi:diguanylate cyclase (GGDEF)-like protein